MSGWFVVPVIVVYSIWTRSCAVELEGWLEFRVEGRETGVAHLAFEEHHVAKYALDFEEPAKGGFAEFGVQLCGAKGSRVFGAKVNVEWKTVAAADAGPGFSRVKGPSVGHECTRDPRSVCKR